MKKILIIVASLGIISSLAAQSGRNTGVRDDQDPAYSTPKKTVDTPHFETLPAEGVPAGQDADKFCAVISGGKIAVIYKGKAINENTTLANGTVIFKDGTVVTPKGTKRVLRKGECVNKNGDNI